ncbi:uncharacterized protein LOC106779147 [Vigna radiata var. radiata]|uniref:Uncharacterized protein LOC106779147 n=1 Tax=Vigna radiata var. radiata TaxID=3916 RepID=A0A3Q0EM60_VIGRR|nr:uncharacterized protein LOC106779147 [Vigna radiata var. radiata]XP_022632168.1 uncharacterized protein LOC106779147 [Vigna radiata var. radiata]XP_022632169.1 uncharacterized protein LOC106779147 [Vigna radiata var. radiata]XP_022632170.1 uncharacterized protein LOC106779147 [Vigna radiata var. radiata]XP_022632171.1 uncharacterized protein LOC106779147 [Vigna radiata var. radiata]XP_022632172.1 uncharacterized protein LOC106779147 [Vigna radiata var. radiata]XP_022632173.1 uncharacterize
MATVSSFTWSAGGSGGGSSSVGGGSSSHSEASSREVASLGSASSGGDRIWHDAALSLLEGGVVVDGLDGTPAGGWPTIGGYTWASHDVGSFKSEIKTRGELLEWANQTYLVRDEEDARLIRLGVCRPNEWVFHGKGSSIEDFFFVYTYLFKRMHVRIPFSRFQAAVLRQMNVAPCQLCQLHPNGWACIQAFIVMCAALGIKPTLPLFFLYFHVRPPSKHGWVSLTSVQDSCLFKAYSDSFKKFKTSLFKVIIKEAGRNQFRNDVGEPLFPYYWTENPSRVCAVAVEDLTPTDVETVRTIDDLPRRLHARPLVRTPNVQVPPRVNVTMAQNVPPEIVNLVATEIPAAQAIPDAQALRTSSSKRKRKSRVFLQEESARGQ